MYEPNNYSYELHPDMLKAMAEEFDPDKITTKFAEAVKGKKAKEVEAQGEAIFGEFGKNWIRQAHKLGEEYPDRTYEVLLEAIDKTGGYYRWALVPQRFIEIAYLSTQDIPVLPIVENNVNRLVYRLSECQINKNLKEKCGDKVADALPCRHACLTLCKTIHEDLEIDAIVEMEATMPKDGYCQFMARRA
ncbi:MAG: hypothetical protein V3V37_04560 [Candidatus Adiutricales bacterium]